MALVTEPSKGSNYVTVTARLYKTEDGRVVPGTDRAARWLFYAEGSQMSRADAERYGLLAEPESQPDPEPEQASETKRRPRPANKARTPGEDK